MRYSRLPIVIFAFATVSGACSSGASSSGHAASGATTGGITNVNTPAGSGGAIGGAANASGGQAGAGSPASGGATGGVADAGTAGAGPGGTAAAGGGSGGSGGTKATNEWTGTWAAAPQGCDGSFNQRTLRQIVHTSIGGTSARVRISNTYSSGPVEITDVHVAARTTGSSIDPATDHGLTFGGKADVTIAPGMFAVSDGAAFAVKPLSDIAVSFYVVSNSGTSCHQSGFQTNYAVAGNMVSSATLAGAQTNGSYYFLSNLDVLNPEAEGAVVTLGASITDGYKAPSDANRRWPNDLAVRLVMGKRLIGVLNQGISADGVKNAVARFDRDVLSQANVKWVIFSDNAINDLGGFKPPAQVEIDQMKTMMTKAHAKGVKFLCSTLTPFEPAEPGRTAINDFIRTPDSGCDGIVDQDTATHDPAAPTKWLPAFNSGDSLHPNTPGLQAIADAVNFDSFK